MPGVVYSDTKVLRFMDRLDRSDGPLAAPVHVRIKPTNACNENCWFCAYRHDDLQLGGGMAVRDRIPREKMREIVEDLIAMGVRAVTFSGGGEPLVYPWFAETVGRLRLGGVRVGALTNGLRLCGENADALAEYGTWVRVSIDGWDAKSYATSRRVQPRAFEQVCENIAAFAARGSECTVGVSFIVTRENAGHIAEACALFKRLGARHVKISPCIVADDAAQNNAYHDGIAPQVRSEIERAKALEEREFAIVDHYHALPELFTRSYDRCRMLQFLTVIGADLAVYTCQDKAYTTAGFLGSLRERRFSELWFSQEVADLVRTFDPRTSCRHHCVAHQKNLLLAESSSIDPAHAVFV